MENLKANLVPKEELVRLEAKHLRCHLNVGDVWKQLQIVAKAKNGLILKKNIKRLQKKPFQT